MEVLEKVQGWKEEEFDVVLQYMRTVLLKRTAGFYELLSVGLCNANNCFQTELL